MVYKLLLCLISPNFPPFFFVFGVKKILKVKFVVYYEMTKMGANELIHCIISNRYGALFKQNN